MTSEKLNAQDVWCCASRHSEVETAWTAALYEEAQRSKPLTPPANAGRPSPSRGEGDKPWAGHAVPAQTVKPKNRAPWWPKPQGTGGQATSGTLPKGVQLTEEEKGIATDQWPWTTLSFLIGSRKSLDKLAERNGISRHHRWVHPEYGYCYRLHHTQVKALLAVDKQYAEFLARKAAWERSMEKFPPGAAGYRAAGARSSRVGRAGNRAGGKTTARTTARKGGK